MSSCTQVWRFAMSKFLICDQARQVWVTNMQSFLFICRCRLMDTDLGTDYIFFSLTCCPHVSSLFMLSIHKGRILSRLVWAEWTRRTGSTVQVTEKVSQASSVSCVHKTYYQPNGLKLSSSLCEFYFLKDFTHFFPAQSLHMHTKQAPKNKIPIKNWTRVIFLKHTVSLGENTRPTAEKLASM